MRIVFFGCDDFAAVHLERLISDGHTIAALVTQPDKPKGRGLHIVYSETKEIALRYPIEVFQPLNLRDSDVIAQLKSYRADVFVVVAYGKFLPEEVLILPKYFCINVHPSLLPKYRGAAPVNWAIINGETETGVTLIKMNASMDGGDILAQQNCPVALDVNSVCLRDFLSTMGADMLSALLPKLPSGAFELIKQDATHATRASKMLKDLGHIHWTDSAVKIHNLVRGTQPWPGAYTFFRGIQLKVLETALTDITAQGAPGEILQIGPEGFCVQAGDQALLVKRVHPAGSRAMDARSFCAGHKFLPKEQLGE